jgi:hypothetical protein
MSKIQRKCQISEDLRILSLISNSRLPLIKTAPNRHTKLRQFFWPGAVRLRHTYISQKASLPFDYRDVIEAFQLHSCAFYLAVRISVDVDCCLIDQRTVKFLIFECCVLTIKY